MCFTLHPYFLYFCLSKAKALSYSETDLRKPKRFATISFALRKKKKKDEENMSNSTFGLPTQGIEEREEVTVNQYCRFLKN